MKSTRFHRPVILFLILIAAARSWSNNVRLVNSAALGRRGGHFSKCTKLQKRDQTNLFAFPWFGGGDEDKKNQDESSDEVLGVHLEGVANIVDSMVSFKTSQRVGERSSAVLQDLKNVLVEGASKDGKVKVTYNGQQKPIGVQIEEAYFQSLKSNKDGADELSDALSKAMQEAHSKSAAKMEEKLKSLYSDLGFETS